MGQSEVKLPGWIERANRQIADRRRALDADQPSRPRVGEIWLAQPPPGVSLERRLVCVVEVDRCERAVRVILLSNETEMASRRDVVVPGAATGLPYDLLAEASVRGWLWWSQLERRLGRLEPRWTEVVERAIEDAVEPAGGDPRPTAGSALEAVQSYRRAEGELLGGLAASCESTRAAAHGDLPLVVDPRLIAEVGDENVSARARRLVRLAGELAGSTAVFVPGGSIRDLLDALEDGPGPGPDLTAAVRPLLEGALSGLAVGGGSPGPPPAASGAAGSPETGHDPLAALLASLAAANRREVVVLTEDRGGVSLDPRGGVSAAATASGGPTAATIVRRRLEVHP